MLRNDGVSNTLLTVFLPGYNRFSALCRKSLIIQQAYLLDVGLVRFPNAARHLATTHQLKIAGYNIIHLFSEVFMKAKLLKIIAGLTAMVTPGVVLAAATCCAIGAACCTGDMPCCP